MKKFLLFSAAAIGVLFTAHKCTTDDNDGVDLDSAKRYPGLAVARFPATGSIHPARGTYGSYTARNKAQKDCVDAVLGKVCETMAETKAGSPQCIVWARSGYSHHTALVKKPGMDDGFTTMKKKCASEFDKNALNENRWCHVGLIDGICNDAELSAELDRVKTEDAVLTEAILRRRGHENSGRPYPLTPEALADVARRIGNNMEVYVRDRGFLSPVFYTVSADTPAYENADTASQKNAILEKGSCVLAVNGSLDYMGVVAFDLNGHRTQGLVPTSALTEDPALQASACTARFQRAPL